MTRLALAVCIALVLLPVAAVAQSAPVAREGSAVYPGLDVNITAPDGLRRLHLAFEAQCVNVKSAQAAISPQAQEAVLLLLRDKTLADLTALRGKERLKNDLVAALNRAIGGPWVVRVLYLQFVII